MREIKSVMEKISFSVLNIIYYIIFIVSFVSFLFMNRSMIEFSTMFLVISFICGIVFLGTVFYVIKRFYNKNEKFRDFMVHKEKLVLTMWFLALFILQIVIILSSDSMINWDPRTIFDTAVSDDFQPIFTDYFSYYPNNTVLVFSIRAIYNALYELFAIDVVTFRTVLIVINIFLVDVGLYFGYKITKRLFNLKTAYIYLFLITLLFGLSPWLMVIYSDTLSIPFVTAVLYLILRIYDQKKMIMKILLSIFTGIVLYFGYAIKPSVMIVVVAVGIISFIIKLNKPKELIQYIFIMSLLLGAFASCRYMWNSYIYDYQTEMDINREIAFPWTYWVATGLHEPYGICNEEDQWATVYRGSSERMYELHKEIIKERLLEKGPVGYVEFLLHKMQWVTSEGFFFWGEEISLENFANWENSNMNFFKNFYYYNGEYNSIFYFYYQGIWGAILFALLIPMKSRWTKMPRKQEKALLLIRCILVGIILYILLLEGRPRYLIQYLPYFAMVSAVGFKTIVEKYTSGEKDETNYE